MTTLAQAEQAIEDLIRTWLDTYLVRHERLNGLAPRHYGGRSSMRLRSWRIEDRIDLLPEDQMPALQVVSAGAVDEPQDTGDGSLAGEYRFVIIVAFKGARRSDSQRGARIYGQAVAELVEHQVGTIASLRPTSRPVDTYDEFPNPDGRDYRGVAAVAFRVVIDGLRSTGVADDAPTVPIDPSVPPPPDPAAPTVQSVTFTTRHLDDPEQTP